MLTKLLQYSTVHSNRIESNSINSTIRNRLFLQLFISEMIHAKQWHYSLHRDFQQLHSTHSTRRNPWDSSSTNSTYRRQGDLLSSLQRPTRHSRHSSRKTLHRHSSSTRTFQTFQSFMTFQHFFNQNANSTHRLVSTRNSIECQSNTRH